MSRSVLAQPNALGVVPLLVLAMWLVTASLSAGFIVFSGEWYGRVTISDFELPTWALAGTWAAFDVPIAIVGWRTWQRDADGQLMRLWLGQLALNVSWPPLFFVAHQADLALGVSVLLLASVTIFVKKVCRSDYVSTWLLLGCGLFTALAVILNICVFFGFASQTT